jgi:hypothetical protein
MTNHDPLKSALAELVFSATAWGVASLQLFKDAKYDPLRDCVIEVIPISDTQSMVKVAGNGDVHWYNLVVQTHKKP